MRGFLPGRPTLAITRPCGKHTSDADAIKMRVTCRCLLRYGAESLLSSWDSSSAEAQLPGSFFLSQLPSELTTEERDFQKSANALKLSFLLSEIIAQNHMHCSAFS